jgi:hypothetical protein
VVTHEAQLAAHLALASLLPIVPILLLPFILVFFVVVVPIWAIALGVVGLVFVIVRGASSVANQVGIHVLDAPAAAVYRAFR